MKKSRGVLCKPVRLKYAFIKANQHVWPIRRMCKTFSIHPSGYYAWLKHPVSKQEKRRHYIRGFIKQFWLESGGVYGYRKIYSDLREEGMTCGINQVHRLMKQEGIQSQRGYRKPRPKVGTENVIVANRLVREFNPTAPNQSWVTDITYIKTHEGWLYLAVIVDLFSRRVIGWSMKSRMTKV
ncbi:MAG: IS3 family transposase [Providencia sp.]|nr:IS3 family transposase [Providencia sp.]